MVSLINATAEWQRQYKILAVIYNDYNLKTRIEPVICILNGISWLIFAKSTPNQILSFSINLHFTPRDLFPIHAYNVIPSFSSFPNKILNANFRTSLRSIGDFLL